MSQGLVQWEGPVHPFPLPAAAAVCIIIGYGPKISELARHIGEKALIGAIEYKGESRCIKIFCQKVL